MKQFLLPLVFLSISGVAAHDQAKPPTQAVSQNEPEFVLRIQFKSPSAPDYEINSKIKVGSPGSSPVDMNGLNPKVEMFNLISESLKAPRNGVYAVSLTPIMRMNAGCCLDGTSVLLLTPDKPYRWRVVPQGSVYYTVTLISFKTTK